MRFSRSILYLAIGQTIVWAGIYYIFPALLLRWESAELWSKTDLTAAFTGAVIFSALFSPSAGRWIDRGHGPKLLAGSALLGALAVACLPLAQTVTQFSIIWLVIGVAMAGSLYEPCFALITRTRGVEAKRSITVVTLFAGFASTLSFPLNHAVADSFGWEVAAWTMAALVIFIGVPLMWLGANQVERDFQAHQASLKFQDDHKPPEKFRLSTLLKNPVFWFVAISFSLLEANHSLIISHLLPIMHDRTVNPDTAIFAASMIGPMQVTGRLAMVAMERYVSSLMIGFLCFLGLSMSVGFLYFTASEGTFLILFVILQGSAIGISSIIKPVVARETLGEQNFGSISGAMALSYLMFRAMAPFGGSVLWETGGYDLTLKVVFVITIIGGISYLFAIRHVNRS